MTFGLWLSTYKCSFKSTRFSISVYASCPSGWDSYGTHCYKFTTDIQDWVSARVSNTMNSLVFMYLANLDCLFTSPAIVHALLSIAYFLKKNNICKNIFQEYDQGVNSLYQAKCKQFGHKPGSTLFF